MFIWIISWERIVFFKSLITYFSDVNLFLKSIKCKRSQSRVIKMSVVVTEFMALVLILGVFWKYLVSYLVHTVALIQLRKRLSEKWVGSPRIHLFHPPPAPNTHIHLHTHTLMLIWFEKISGNIIINFSSCWNDYSCLTALCWNSWNIHLPLLQVVGGM